MSKSISDLVYDAVKQIVGQELEVVGLQVRDGLGQSCRMDEVETIVEGVVNHATAEYRERIDELERQLLGAYIGDTSDA